MEMIIRVPFPDGSIREWTGTPETLRWQYWLTAQARPFEHWRNKTTAFSLIVDYARYHHVTSVIETCGGLGVLTTMIQEGVPDVLRHVVIDIEPAAVVLLRSLGLPITVVQGDAAELIPYYANDTIDLVIVDYSKFTLYHAAKNPDDWDSRLLNNLAKILRPKILVVTDTAIAKFHLNRERYQQYFGVKLSKINDYHNLYAKLYPAYDLRAIITFYTNGGGAAHLVLHRRGA